MIRERERKTELYYSLCSSILFCMRVFEFEIQIRLLYIYIHNWKQFFDKQAGQISKQEDAVLPSLSI